MKPGYWHDFVSDGARCLDCGETRFGGFHYPPKRVRFHVYEPKDPAKPWYRTKPGMESLEAFAPWGIEEELEPEHTPVDHSPQLGLFGGM